MFKNILKNSVRRNSSKLLRTSATKARGKGKGTGKKSNTQNNYCATTSTSHEPSLEKSIIKILLTLNPKRNYTCRVIFYSLFLFSSKSKVFRIIHRNPLLCGVCQKVAISSFNIAFNQYIQNNVFNSILYQTIHFLTFCLKLLNTIFSFI